MISKIHGSFHKFLISSLLLLMLCCSSSIGFADELELRGIQTVMFQGHKIDIIQAVPALGGYVASIRRHPSTSIEMTSLFQQYGSAPHQCMDLYRITMAIRGWNLALKGYPHAIRISLGIVSKLIPVRHQKSISEQAEWFSNIYSFKKGQNGFFCFYGTQPSRVSLLWSPKIGVTPLHLIIIPSI